MSYLNKKMNFRFLKVPAGKFFAWGKIPAGIVKNLCGEYFPRSDFDLCRGIFSRSL